MNNIIVIGAGVAGLTASIYLGRSGLKVSVIAGDVPGGQLTKTSFVENYPGFAKPILGVDLMMQMMEQASRFGAEIIYDTVTSVTIERIVTLASGTAVAPDAILIATGCSHNKLGIPGEHEFTNKGVSWCATCDGPLYRNKKVAVVGGGNAAVMEAIFLSNFASEVLLIHRRDTLRADKSEQEKIFSNSKIKCIWNSEVINIQGDSKLKSITLRNKHDRCTDMEIDGLFIAIGMHPATDFVKEVVRLDNAGYVIASETETSVPGIFVAGDVVSGSLKQAIYAAGQGALAARAIERWLGVRL